jgi:hypothetical protein
MPDDLLGQIADAADDQQRAVGGIVDVIGRIAGDAARRRVAAQTADPAPLMRLDPVGWASVVRYLAPDDLVAVLARADLAVAARLAGTLDSDGRAWLACQETALEAIDAATHAAAMGRLLALVRRLVDAGRIVLHDAPVSPDVFRVSENTSPEPVPSKRSDPPRPVADPMSVAVVARDGLGLGGGVAVPEDPGVAATDPSLVDALASVVEAAHGASPERLVALASASPHPVLAHGLRLVAAGATAHEIAAGLEEVTARWLAARQAEARLVAEAVLAVRFGEAPDRFLGRVRAMPPGATVADGTTSHL